MTAVTTASITDFLLARIEAEEQIARETVAGHDPLDWSISQPGVGIEGPVDGPSGYEAIIIDPARVLADCAARRAIVDGLDVTPCPCATSSRCVVHDSSAGPPEFARDRYVDPVTELTLRHLASVYADHDEYDPAWRM